VQPPQQSPNYSQPSPQQTANYSQLQSSKSSEEYSTGTAPPVSYPQDFKQNPTYVQQPSTTIINESEHRTEYLKSNAIDKPVTSDQQRNFQTESSLNLNTNHQIYQPPGPYPPTYPNSFSNIELQRSSSRHSSQQQQTTQQSQERPSFTEIQPRGFITKAPPGNNNEQLSTPAPDQTQLLAFQQNLTTAHESLYPSGFQPSSYPLPPNTRPMYSSPHYFDAGSKPIGGSSSGSNGGASNSPNGNLPPMKKRAYEPTTPSVEPSSRVLSQENTVTRPSQEQFSSFDPMMSLPQPDTVTSGQFDSTPFGSLADSVASSSAYARLGLGLTGLGRPSKEQQQLLTIPRPPPTAKPEHLAAYGRTGAPSTTELEQLNLLQSLQSAAAKNSQGILAISRRENIAPVSVTPTVTTPSKPKKSRKSKHPQQQEQQNASATTVTTSTVADQQTGISAFPQYAATSAATAVAAADSIGALKSAAVTVPPPAGSAFNFAAATSSATTSHASFAYDKDAAAAFAFLTDEFRNPTSYYNMALRQQQQQQQQQPPVVPPTVTNASGQPTCNKLGNQPPPPPPPRNYPPPHPFLHSAAAAAQRSAAAYVPPVSAYVTPHGPNLAVDPAAYQQYLHSLYAFQPHHRPSWL